MAVACFCGGEVAAQQRLEIEVTRFGVPRTIEVDRYIQELDLRESGLTSIALPNGLTNLEWMYLHDNQLTNFTLPAGLRDLRVLELSGNHLTNITLPKGLPNLQYLYLSGNELQSLSLTAGLRELEQLNLSSNQLTSITLPAGLTSLDHLNLSSNQLTSFTLSAGLTHLRFLNLSQNQLTNFTFLAGLTRLSHLDLFGNQLMSLTLPDRLPNLKSLILSGNQLTNLTLPKDSSQEKYGSSWGRPFNLSLLIDNVPLRSLRIPARLEGKVLLYTNSSDSRGHLDTDSLPLLDITYYVPPVELEISWVGNDLEISWNDNGVLQIATSVDGPWHDVNLESPIKLQRHFISSIPAEFFRVRAE